jgi:hypothetical protein
MEEEKKKRVTKREKEVSIPDYKVFSPSVAKNKKEYRVVAVSLATVIFEVSKGNNSFTSNIWGMQLKPGDTIYI